MVTDWLFRGQRNQGSNISTGAKPNIGVAIAAAAGIIAKITACGDDDDGPRNFCASRP